VKVIDGDPDLREFLRPGDRIVLGHACGEPVTLVEALLAQAAGIDVIVTEFGAAELKGQPLAERARRLTAIAHPRFRDELEREARLVLLTGGR
jgi:acyl-CoA hydrolase